MGYDPHWGPSDQIANGFAIYAMYNEGSGVFIREKEFYPLFPLNLYFGK